TGGVERRQGRGGPVDNLDQLELQATDDLRRVIGWRRPDQVRAPGNDLDGDEGAEVDRGADLYVCSLEAVAPGAGCRTAGTAGKGQPVGGAERLRRRDGKGAGDAGPLRPAGR